MKSWTRRLAAGMLIGSIAMAGLPGFLVAKEHDSKEESEEKSEHHKNDKKASAAKSTKKKKKHVSKKPDHVQRKLTTQNESGSSSNQVAVPTTPSEFVSPSRNIDGLLSVVPDENGVPVLWLEDANSTQFRLLLPATAAERLQAHVGKRLRVRGEVVGHRGQMAVRNIRGIQPLPARSVPGKRSSDESSPEAQPASPSASPIDAVGNSGAPAGASAPAVPGDNANSTKAGLPIPAGETQQ